MDLHHFAAQKKDSAISRKEKKGSQLPYFNEKVKLAYTRVLCKVRKTQHQNLVSINISY
jgi:hypothetical protein